MRRPYVPERGTTIWLINEHGSYMVHTPATELTIDRVLDLVQQVMAAAGYSVRAEEIVYEPEEQR